MRTATDLSAATASRLSIANTHEALSDVEAWVRSIAARHDLSERDLFHLDLVLTEAVTNIMDYGHAVSGPGRIHLTCVVDRLAVAVEVIDDGPPFDPTTRPEPALPRRIEDAVPGGLGIHLIRRYTRAMRYLRDNGRNVLTLTLPRDAEAPSP